MNTDDAFIFFLVSRCEMVSQMSLYFGGRGIGGGWATPLLRGLQSDGDSVTLNALLGVARYFVLADRVLVPNASFGFKTTSDHDAFQSVRAVDRRNCAPFVT